MDHPPDPLVTVLVPTYNRAALLVESVRSALAQNYPMTEIIVLDDASPDDTAAAIVGFRADPRFRYVRHPANLGIAGNWRAGISMARGDFFCLLHDDDTLEPSFIETLLSPLHGDPALALSFCEHATMDEEGKRTSDSSHRQRFARDRMTPGLLQGDALQRAILFDYSVPVGSALFRRSVVVPEFVDDRAKGAIDYWLLYRVLQTGAGAYYLPKPLMNYRVHGGGMSGSAIAYMTEGHLFRLETMLADPSLAAHHRELAESSHRMLTVYGVELARLGRRGEARRALVKALREKFSLRTLAALTLACAGALGSRVLRHLRERRR